MITCQWNTCRQDFIEPSCLIPHITKCHLSSKTRPLIFNKRLCQWSSCSQASFDSDDAILQHLLVQHGIIKEEQEDSLFLLTCLWNQCGRYLASIFFKKKTISLGRCQIV